jgi:PAS domain S-box-containing protein
MMNEDKTKEELLVEIASLRKEMIKLEAFEAQYRNSEEEFRSSATLFLQVLSSISDHIYVSQVNKEGHRLNLYLSPHAEDLTGYPLQKFVSDWTFWPSKVIHPDDREMAAAQAAQLAQGQDSEVEYRMIRADDEIIWVRDSGKARFDEHSQALYIYGVVSDITERKRLEEQLLAIHQLGRELNLLRNEGAIFERVLETTVRILQPDKASCALVNEETRQLETHYQFAGNEFREIKPHLPLDGQHLVATVVATGQATTSIQLSSEFPRLPSSATLHVPMKIKDRVLGVLSVERAEADKFSPNDQQIVQTLADQAVVALENAHLYREIGQRVEELATMNMISQVITSTLDLHQILSVITDHTVRLLDAMAASVALYDNARGDLWFDVASGDHASFIRGSRIRLGEGIVGWVVQRGEPALVPDVGQDARFAQSFDQQTGFITHSIVCVPLQTRSETIGAIEVINKRKGEFDKKDLRLLTWLSLPAATAIENAQLYEAQIQAREQAETLREATSALTSTLDLGKVLNRMLIHLEQVIPYTSACIFLREGDWMRIVAGRGELVIEKGLINQLRHSVDNVLYQEIQRTGSPLILEDALADPRFEIWENGIDNVRGWMGVPLMVRSEVIGYLTLDSQELNAYKQVEADLAQAFANQAAVAIHNARLFEEVSLGHKRLQSLSHRLVQAQETERRRVARELHDEAGQALTSLMVGLRLLEKEIDQPERVPARVAELKHTTDGVLENLHRLAMDLRPASLDHLGLVPALRQYLGMFGAQHGLTLQFETVGLDDERLPPPIEINLYRIVQEALTNVVRHAKATQADVLLERRENQIITIIEDNGTGFDPETRSQSGRLGLLGMRERAEMMDGQLSVESTPNVGTTIYVEIPYVYTDPNC